jgi:hypothetical protein
MTIRKLSPMLDELQIEALRLPMQFKVRVFLYFNNDTRLVTFIIMIRPSQKAAFVESDK